jgi:hypothetical protein
MYDVSMQHRYDAEGARIAKGTFSAAPPLPKTSSCPPTARVVPSP